MKLKPVIVCLKVLIATVTVTAAAASGCQLFSSGTLCETGGCEAFEIHLNNNFEDDRVRVEIDNRTVFDRRVTTNYILSLAEIINLQRPAGMHRIRVVVNGYEERGKTFGLDRKLFIHVRYYPEAIPDREIPEGVAIEISEIRPMYD